MINPLWIAGIGSLVRWVLTAAGASAVATSDAAQHSPDLASFVSSLPQEWQALVGALVTLVSLGWSWWQKNRVVKKEAEYRAPVEDRVIS